MTANDNYAVFSAQSLTVEDIAAFEAMFEKLDTVFADMSELNQLLRRVLTPFQEDRQAIEPSSCL